MTDNYLSDQDIGARVKKTRDQLRLTQAELADLLSESGEKITQQTVHRIETGQRSLKLSEAQRLADSLGTHVSALVEPETPFMRERANATIRLRRLHKAAQEMALAMDSLNFDLELAEDSLVGVEESADPERDGEWLEDFKKGYARTTGRSILDVLKMMAPLKMHLDRTVEWTEELAPGCTEHKVDPHFSFHYPGAPKPTRIPELEDDE